jgi:hypothetical protein
MKKNKSQDQFFIELEKVPIVQVACEKIRVRLNNNHTKIHLTEVDY